MKRLIIYFLGVAAFFSSCKKSDNSSVFGNSADNRINDTLDMYQALLTSGSPYGWKGLVYPSGANGGVFGFYFKFNDSNRVVMFSDFDSASSVTPKESSYRLKALQQPSLIFDTYSYLHLLSDPNGSVNGGTYGEGLASDFEFAIDGASGDTLYLTGRFHGSKAYLIKATQQDAAAYYNGQYGSRLFENIDKYLYYFKRVIIGGVAYDVSVNQTNHTITFSWLDGSGNLQTFTTGYYYTPDGIALAPPLVNGSTTISSFDNMTWDPGNIKLSFTVNGSATAITGVNTPVSIDKNAPLAWYQYAINNGGLYWISVDGFHVNGVDDAYNIKSLATDSSTYYYLLYWPNVNNYGYDVFLPTFLNANTQSLDIIYGTAQRPSFTSDGRVVFKYLGDLTVGPYPSSGPAADSRTRLYNSSGYYLVQTSATSYDMVSAADSRIWMTWYWIF